MVQRYVVVDTNLGVNPYLTYSNAGFPTASSPSPLSQLGISAGNWYNGNLGTTWMMVDMAAGQGSVAAGGTIYANPASTPPFQGTTASVAGGITGTVLVSVPATPTTLPNSTIPGATGVWAEISGKTLNLTPATMEEAPLKNHGESDADYKKRLHAWCVWQGLNDDGTLMTREQKAHAEAELSGQATVAHPAAQPPLHPSQAQAAAQRNGPRHS